MSTEVSGSLDIRAYLDRIRFTMPIDLSAPEPSLPLLQALHEAHMLAVPFENLSIHYGQPIILDEAQLHDKIVRRHRGGFCYELNGLFAWLLRRLGYDVTLLSAGVAQGDGAFTPEFDHLTLLVRHLEGADWLADVGFGDSFRRPLRFEAEMEQEGADGHSYRLHPDEHSDENPESHPAYWMMQQRGELGWEAQYRFTLQPHALTDFEERCQYQQTSPESHFTQRRVCSLALPDGRITLSDLRLITTLHGQRNERGLSSEEEYRAALAERFGVVV